MKKLILVSILILIFGLGCKAEVEEPDNGRSTLTIWRSFTVDLVDIDSIVKDKELVYIDAVKYELEMDPSGDIMIAGQGFTDKPWDRWEYQEFAQLENGVDYSLNVRFNTIEIIGTKREKGE